LLKDNKLQVKKVFARIETLNYTTMKKMDENKALAQRFYNEVINSHNVASIKSFVTTDFIDHNPSPGHTGKGLDDLVAQFNELFTALPDCHVTLDLMVAEEDTVVAYLTMTGTNKGPFGNMPASNKPVKINGIDIVRIKDGKATERWGVFDDLSMMTQMGMVSSYATHSI
jgi:steroid delta-isomerase-like uncharacterized protein